MDCVAIYFHIDIEHDEDTSQNLKRSFLWDASCPLELPETAFRRLFRLSKASFPFLLEEIIPKMKNAKNSRCIPPIIKLAATLRFLAHGSYQVSVGQDYLIAMAQPTVSVIMAEVLDSLESLCGSYIKFDQTDEEKQKNKQYYYLKAGFPGIISSIDGTHINIIRPTENEHHFYNRKGNHSINVMATCNYKLLILSVDANHGGCSHDSFVWSMSAEREYLRNKHRTGDKTSWLLGDSGYGLEPWLITPYRNAVEFTNEAKFNKLHSKCRVTIERCFEVLKTRFRCLLGARELHYKPKKAAQIVNVACMLHNICILRNEQFDESLAEQNLHYAVDDINSSNLLTEPKSLRDRIKDTL